LTQAVRCLGLATRKKDDKPQAVRCIGGKKLLLLINKKIINNKIMLELSSTITV